jgi:hypothetical protein
MFAILPLSSCVKALGVLDARRSGRFGEPESDANCDNNQLLMEPRRSGMTCLDIARFAPAVEVVVIRLVFDQDATTKIIKCCLLVAIKHRPCETKHIGGDLMVLPIAKLMPSSFTHQLQFWLYGIEQLRFCLDDTVLLSNEANKDGEFKVAQCLHLLDQTIVRFFHLSDTHVESSFACRFNKAVRFCLLSLLVLFVGEVR